MNKTPETIASPNVRIGERTKAVLSVLVWTFVLNLLTCLGKIVVGLYAGLLNVLADGIHSLSDTLINVIGYVSIKFSGKTPDDKYPYGYQKYETVATLIVGCIAFILFLELIKAAVEKLMYPEVTEVTTVVYVVMAISILLNIITVLYEGRMGRRLKSEFLIADSKETSVDIFISLGIIIALFFISKGWTWVDGAITLLISLIVLKHSLEIFRMGTKILVDEAVLDPNEVIDTVTSHPDISWAHMVRSRGKPDVIYVDIHIGVAASTTVEKAHDEISHEVKQLMVKQFPDVKCVTIHIEPDNESAKKRERSVFRYRDL